MRGPDGSRFSGDTPSAKQDGRRVHPNSNQSMVYTVPRLTEGGMAGVLLPFASVQGGPLRRCALPMEMPQACSRHAGWMVNTD